MESTANQQWAGLLSVLLLASMVVAPFILTWVFCDRPEAFIKRWLRATVASLVVIAVSAGLLLLFFPPYFPDGEITRKVADTAANGLIAAVIAPFFGTDFLMRMKVSYKLRKSQGQSEL